jgi:hypothetical protein
MREMMYWDYLIMTWGNMGGLLWMVGFRRFIEMELLKLMGMSRKLGIEKFL